MQSCTLDQSHAWWNLQGHIHCIAATVLLPWRSQSVFVKSEYCCGFASTGFIKWVTQCTAGSYEEEKGSDTHAPWKSVLNESHSLSGPIVLFLHIAWPGLNKDKQCAHAKSRSLYSFAKYTQLHAVNSYLPVFDPKVLHSLRPSCRWLRRFYPACSECLSMSTFTTLTVWARWEPRLMSIPATSISITLSQSSTSRTTKSWNLWWVETTEAIHMTTKRNEHLLMQEIITVMRAECGDCTPVQIIQWRLFLKFLLSNIAAWWQHKKKKTTHGNHLQVRIRSLIKVDQNLRVSDM